MSSLPRPRYTPEQYLEMERKADFRSEYVNGEILAMAGASREHNRITLNIGSILTRLLAATPCEPFATDMRVRIASARFTYPDIVVACEPQFDETELDTQLNPLVIFEVASPSIVHDDRGWKSAYYRRQETLVDYVLVAQDRPSMEHYSRQDQDRWGLREIYGLASILRLPAIGCELPLAQIYDRVMFEPDPLMPPETEE